MKQPVYHMVFSWPEGENPSDDTIYKFSKDALLMNDIDTHQYVMAIHRDTDHTHVHLVINKVNYRTLKCFPVYNDHYRFDKTMRALEIKYNFKRCEGAYITKRDSHGDEIVVRKSESADKNRDNRLHNAANKMESFSAQVSFVSYARDAMAQEFEEGLEGHADGAGDWRALHRRLGRHSIGLKPYGQGFVLYDMHDPDAVHVKASSVSRDLAKKRLSDRLGVFEAIDEEIYFDRRYVAALEIDAIASVRERRKAERRQMRQQLQARYYEEREKYLPAPMDYQGIRQQFRDIHAWERDQRHWVLENFNYYDHRQEIKARFTEIAYYKLRKELDLRAQVREMKQARKAIDFPSFPQWVAIRAEQGDKAAISQQRGWLYAQQKKDREAAKAKTEPDITKDPRYLPYPKPPWVS